MGTYSLEGLVFECVIVEMANNVMTITLNRPEKKNSISPTLGKELAYAIRAAGQDSEVRVVVLAAKGDIFCAGGDLGAMRDGAPESTSTVPEVNDGKELSTLLRDICKPVIVKAQGPVLAGGLLMTCNATHVVAADHIYFSAPEIKRALWPFMVMAGLFRVMPRRQGLDFAMRGFRIDAQKALELGLATDVVPADQLDQRVDELASEIASYSPATIKLGLEAFYHQENMEFDEAIPYLKGMLEKTKQTEDVKEGITAFFEKREPVWKGR